MNKEVLSTKEKREKVMELILSKEYGETVTYEELNEILDRNLQDYRERDYFRREMNKVKNSLFEHGYVIRPVFNVGYYVLKPNQVSSYTYRNYIVKPINSFKKAKTILDHTESNKIKGQEITEFRTTCSLNEAMIYACTELVNSDEYKKLK